ncbi:MAG: DUF2061 domain-containing protein [Silicimonas sp.]|nr:DUF2061 domain-containing protein [Silicimonas sp.]
MESRLRTIVKTVTWQTTGLLVMCAVAYFATGSLVVASGLALTSTAIGTVSYVLHERIWARIAWGR